MQKLYGVKKSQKYGRVEHCVRNYIDRTLEIIEFKKIRVKYIGRNASSTTATGNYNKHLAEQKKIMEKVVGKMN